MQDLGATPPGDRADPKSGSSTPGGGKGVRCLVLLLGRMARRVSCMISVTSLGDLGVNLWACLEHMTGPSGCTAVAIVIGGESHMCGNEGRWVRVQVWVPLAPLTCQPGRVGIWLQRADALHDRHQQACDHVTSLACLCCRPSESGAHTSAPWLTFLQSGNRVPTNNSSHSLVVHFAVPRLCPDLSKHKK